MRARTPEDAEADARRAMAAHAAIQPRGFDSIRERAELHIEVDFHLDEHRLLTSLEAT